MSGSTSLQSRLETQLKALDVVLVGALSCSIGIRHPVTGRRARIWRISRGTEQSFSSD
jgi:hypothetical protein